MKHRPIGVYEPWISQEDVEALTRVAASGWISSAGPEVKLFEKEMAAYIGAEHAVSVMNGTVALHLALLALGIGSGDEVIVPDLTFIATAAAVVATGGRPVFADVCREDWNMDPAEIDRLRTSRTKAVLAVHLYGNPLDYSKLAEHLEDVTLVEDVAEALGASVGDDRTGSLGAVATFSFYGNKTLTTGEGGMITTSDAYLADRMRLLRDHAMSRERRYYHEELGWNFRMTAMQAAIGRSQLQRIENILARKRAIAAGYQQRLSEIPVIELHPQPRGGAQSSYWMYSILLPDRAQRDSLAAYLSSEGIETRPFFIPMSQMPPFREFASSHLRVSAEISDRGLNLPSGPLLSQIDQDFICDTIRNAIAQRKFAQKEFRMPAA
jgi:perosamine synthetase